MVHRVAGSSPISSGCFPSPLTPAPFPSIPHSISLPITTSLSLLFSQTSSPSSILFTQSIYPRYLPRANFSRQFIKDFPLFLPISRLCSLLITLVCTTLPMVVFTELAPTPIQSIDSNVCKSLGQDQEPRGVETSVQRAYD